MKMRRFNLKGLVSRLQGAFSLMYYPHVTGLPKMTKIPSPPLKEPIAQVVNILIGNATLILKEIVEKQRKTIVEKERQIIGMESVIANLRKGKNGQLYYNPNNHSASTIKVIPLYSGWVMVSEKKGLRPVVLSEDEYKEFYGSYVVLPLIDNRAVGNYSDKIKTK